VLLKNEETTMSLEQTELPAPPEYETKSQVGPALERQQADDRQPDEAAPLPFIKLTSKIVRFPKADVDAYLARNFRVRANGLNPGDGG